MVSTEHLTHPIEPLFDSESRILILGSFPSVKSREVSFYYANPTNRFWPVLAAVYGEEIEDRAAFCHRHHIALWDVIASCDIHASDDSSIRNVTCNNIPPLIEKTKVQRIFTTGRKAWNLFAKYIQTEIPAESLPSTSSANAALKFDDLCRMYAVIRRYTDETD